MSESKSSKNSILPRKSWISNRNSTEEDERLIDIIPIHNEEERVMPIVTVRNDSNQKFKVRKKQLFEKLNTHKLTYIKGGICDSYIKYGYPTLEDVISDVSSREEEEERRLQKLLNALKRKGLQYDPNVSYFKEYIEQGTDIKNALKEGKKEWFYLNKTNYTMILPKYKDEDKAQRIALQEYVNQYGYDNYVKMYIGICKEFEMKIQLY
jgi:hypothetical protein